MRYLKTMFACCMLAFFIFACSSSGDSTSATASGETFPVGLAITSPTAQQSSSSSNNLTQAVTLDSEGTLTDKADTLSSLASGSSSCTFALPDFTQAQQDPACYGPKLYYKNHPDGGDQAPQAGDTEASLPTGDLGIWQETEGSTEACAAAKMNADIANIAKKVDMSLLFIANISCLINNDSSLSFPSIGNTENLTTALGSAIASDNPGTTINSATVEYVEDLGGFPVFLYSIDLSTGSSDVVINLRHNKTNASGTEYRGKLWSSFEGGVMGVGDSYAFSLLYDVDVESLDYQMLGMSYDNATVAQPFDSDDNTNVESNWSGNFTQTIANVNPTTGLGSVSYAWQAGNMDDKARVFNIYTEQNNSAINGYAFFGYGQKFDSSTGSLSDNEIERFICNWAGPGNSHAVAAFEQYAQKQVMEVNSSGVFVPTSSNITYAPVNACTYTTASQVDPDLVFELVEGDIAAATASDITDNLVDISTGSDSDYGNYSGPVAPTDF
ncbi:MAG: hypothetical protein R3A45_00400 [Bdellovibrionota bacterium]